MLSKLLGRRAQDVQVAASHRNASLYADISHLSHLYSPAASSLWRIINSMASMDNTNLWMSWDGNFGIYLCTNTET